MVATPAATRTHTLPIQHYTVELAFNRVGLCWRQLVHRLVQNTSDRDGTEAEKVGQEHVGGVQVNSDEKMDSLQLEYTYLLHLR